MWYLVCACLLCMGTDAFAPALIRWSGIPTKKFVLAPSGWRNKHVVPHRAVIPPAQLMIWDQSGRMSSDDIPHFTAQPDKTILYAPGLCVEATGDRSGDAVRVNYCTGAPAQLWSFLLWDHGRKMQIQLKGVNKCLGPGVLETGGGANGVPIELKECADTMTNAWTFEESIPLPSEWHSKAGILAMIGFGVLSLSVWLWRQQRNMRTVALPPRTAFLNLEPGGTCLITPSVGSDMSLASGHAFSRSLHKLIPALMILSPTRVDLESLVKDGEMAEGSADGSTSRAREPSMFQQEQHGATSAPLEDAAITGELDKIDEAALSNLISAKPTRGVDGRLNPVLTLPGDTLETTLFMKVVTAVSTFEFLGVLAWALKCSHNPLWLVFSVLMGTFVGELFSGVFHWATDNYGSLKTPVVGFACAAFQGHHLAPWTISHRSFYNNVYKIAAATIPLMTASVLLLPPNVAAFLAVMLYCQLLAQEFHRWTHTPPNLLPRWRRRLQKANIALPFREHMRHHKSPYDKHYCILTGQLNPILDSEPVLLWRRLEAIVFYFNGQEPLSWKKPEVKEIALRTWPLRSRRADMSSSSQECINGDLDGKSAVRRSTHEQVDGGLELES